MPRGAYLLAALLLVCVQFVRADVFGDADWLRDPRMKGVGVIDYLGRESDAPPKANGPVNVHTLMRTEITLSGAPRSAFLYISGDDYYKFTIDGHPVVQGPEGGYHFSHPYYWLDVTAFLGAGTHCLGAHVYYQGLRNRVWGSADNRSGFIARLEITYQDGSTAVFKTDSSWRVHQLAAFPGEAVTGLQTMFLENIDMRAMPVGWDKVGFDAGAWAEPLIERQDHVFIQQATPPLQRYRVEPAVVRELGAGGYFYDFGTEVVGHTVIQLRGAAGHVIRVRHGEELDDHARVRYQLRANTVYEEKPVLSGGDDTIAFYDYRGFRYLEVLDAPEPPKVHVEVRHHPMGANAAQLSSEDASLQNIFALCRNTVQMGSQGGFVDCPTREKGQYLGDSVIAGRAHLWLTGDPGLTRKTLYDFYLSTQIHPGMMAVAPGHHMQEIAEFPLQYPLLLEAYYNFTGDLAYVTAMVDHVFPGLFKYYGGFENDAGLIENLTKPEKWLVVDWPANLRDGYDYDKSLTSVNTVLNGFYYGALRSAARIERVLGRDGKAYDARADRVADGFAKHLANAETGLYVDTPGSKHSSLHANAIPLAFGLTKGADPARMLALIESKGLRCSPYIASYVIEACFNAGAPDLGYALLTNDSEYGWNAMLRAGATTCTEVWSADLKKNMSWCHIWAASPIYLVAERVFGLAPASAGWGAVRFAPPVIKNLPPTTFNFPHPQGTVEVSYAPDKGYTIKAPEGVTIEVAAPEGVNVDTGASPTIKREVVAVKRHTGEPTLTEDVGELLASHGWRERVGQGTGAWIDVSRQRFYIVEGGKVTWEVPCATATNGTGSKQDSNQTPLGWHQVETKIGEGAPWGQVFRSRKATDEIWKPGGNTTEDLVLTRILWLDGLEPGKNKGTAPDGTVVDSKSRFIYIHGTNGENKIGTPSSHGCIRLYNDDVIVAFERLPVGTPVLITE